MRSTKSSRTLSEAPSTVIVVIFLFLGSIRALIIPVVAIRSPCRRGPPDAVVGSTIRTSARRRHRARGRSRGRRCDCDGGERGSGHLHNGKGTFQAAIEAARELVGPIVAMTHPRSRPCMRNRHPGRAHRRALPRVRVHAGASAVIVSVSSRSRRRSMMVEPSRGGHGGGFAGLDQPAVRIGSEPICRRSGTLRAAVVVLRVVGALLIVPFDMSKAARRLRIRAWSSAPQAAANLMVDHEAGPRNRRTSIIDARLRSIFQIMSPSAASAAW